MKIRIIVLILGLWGTSIVVASPTISSFLVGLVRPIKHLKFSKSDSDDEINRLGEVYRQHGDYQKALDCFNESARRGDPDAEANIGRAYESGQGVPKNVNAAANWYSVSIQDKTSKGGQISTIGQINTESQLNAIYDAALNEQESPEQALNRLDPQKAMELYEKLGLDEEKRKLLNSGE